ncbi:MAG TPA: HepT-like ribonuclease domain-containing protein [Propionibacteriaceae bacterium]|nr:HepT-like ribonuclease domain-containing protein [Propionibacteriaceae bacterium]
MRPDDRAAAFPVGHRHLCPPRRCCRRPTWWEAYLQGAPVAWATERQVELVGEALNNLRKAAPEFAERIPDVHKIIATSNVLIHGYTEVNSTIVWQAATRPFRGLIPTLEALLAEVAPPD